MHVQFPVKSRKAEHVLKEDLSFSFFWASDQPTWRMNSIFFRKSSISKNNEKWIRRHDWKQEIWEKGKNYNRKKKSCYSFMGVWRMKSAAKSLPELWMFWSYLRDTNAAASSPAERTGGILFPLPLTRLTLLPFLLSTCSSNIF